MDNSANIEITPDKLRDAAMQIKNQRLALVEQIGIARATIEGLTRDGWRSAASNLLFERFSLLRQRIESTYPEAMLSYEEYLNKTANEYDLADQETRDKITALFNLGQG